MGRRLVYRVVGPPLGKGAPRSERLRWIRRLNWRCSAPAVAVGVVLIQHLRCGQITVSPVYAGQTPSRT